MALIWYLAIQSVLVDNLAAYVTVFNSYIHLLQLIILECQLMLSSINTFDCKICSTN